jgi:nicotinamidase-related amidase
VSVWDRYLTDSDRLVFQRSGHGATGGFGDRPVLLVVDVTYDFCGERQLSLLDGVDRWPSSCGPRAWTAVDHTRTLLDAARSCGVPVFFTTGLPRGEGDFELGRWRDKHPRTRHDPRGNDIVEELSPRPHEVVVPKGKPSAFFGTLLPSFLTDLGADTVLVCGGSTSGCVRASVVDAFSHNYRVAVVEECTFDRGEASHALSLFDMQQKYADVVSLPDAIGYLERLPKGLFADRWPPSAPLVG